MYEINCELQVSVKSINYFKVLFFILNHHQINSEINSDRHAIRFLLVDTEMSG